MSAEEVKIVKDDGWKNQWGIGRLFYKREGNKDRLQIKSIHWVLVVMFFLIILVVGLRDDSQKSKAGVETFSIPSNNSAESDSKKLERIPVERREEDEARPQNVKKGRTQNSDVLAGGGRFSAFEKVAQDLFGKIPPGSLVKAVLASGASDGPVRALLSENLSIMGEVILKKNSILLGKGSSTDERLMVSFSRVVFKDGTNIEISAQACDLSDKMPGLKGSNVRGKALKLTGAIGLGLVGGTAMGLQQRQSLHTPSTPSMKDALLNGLAVTSIEQARSLGSDLQNTRPLIEVPEKQEFFILFDGER